MGWGDSKKARVFTQCIGRLGRHLGTPTSTKLAVLFVGANWSELVAGGVGQIRRPFRTLNRQPAPKAKRYYFLHKLSVVATRPLQR